jgi:hypothetical protein
MTAPTTALELILEEEVRVGEIETPAVVPGAERCDFDPADLGYSCT